MSSTADFRRWFNKNWQRLVEKKVLEAEDSDLVQCQMVWQSVSEAKEIDYDRVNKVFLLWYNDFKGNLKKNRVSLAEQSKSAWEAAHKVIK